MRVLIRADGGSVMGSGHVMRTLALAELLLAHGAAVTLVGAALDEPLAERARRMGARVERLAVEPGAAGDAREVVALARTADWVVVDGYQFGAAFQTALRDAGIRQLAIDDYGHCDRYAADLVLNQNVDASEALYRERSAHTRLLLGPAYALLRQEFCGRPANDAPGVARRLLVTMGGSDPVNVTPRVLAAVALLDDPALRVRVLVGPTNPHAAALRAGVDDARVELVPPTDAMAALLGWAELAVSAAGSTTYELCCLGVPALLITVADNQRVVASGVAGRGAAVDLGWHDAQAPAQLAAAIDDLRRDRDRRAALSERGRALVDGHGCRRVAHAMFPDQVAAEAAHG